MGVFQKVSGWLADKGDRFIRGEVDHGGGYYATQEARNAYGGMGAEQSMNDEAGEQSESKPAIDPFGRGDGDYGGRVPYRSKYDQEMEAYQQAQQAQAAVQQSVRFQAVAPGAQQNMQQGSAPMPNRAMGQQPTMAQTAVPPGGASRAYSPGYAAPVSNVVPFPGMQRGPDGMVYAHVEYIVLLRSRNECKDVIGYIKTSASVFLNMEFIASDSERQRCVDMLSGAAYTLGCALNKISPRGIYLISSPLVKVVLDPAMQKFSAAPEAQGFNRQRYEQEGYPSPGEQHTASGYEQQGRRPDVQARYFGAESPTARFQAQGSQRSRPTNFNTTMAGGLTDSYPPVNATGNQGNTGRYRTAEYPQ